MRHTSKSVVAVLLLSWVLATPVAEGAVFDVTSAAELASALAAARVNGEGDTLAVQAGTYALGYLSYVPVPGEDNFPLLIEGEGAAVTILEFGGAGSLSIRTSALPDDSNAHVTIRGLTFRNGAGDSGGGLELNGDETEMTVEHCIFVDNLAGDGEGGGFYAFTGSGPITLVGSLLAGNSHGVTNSNGGGAFLQTATGRVTATNNTFVGNTTDGGRGDGLAIWLFEDAARADLYNNVVWGNGVQDIYVNDDGFGSGVGAATNLFDNDYGTFGILIGDQLAQGGNLQVDPMLTGDFHLQVGSPVVDVGDNSAPWLPATDLDDEPRVMDGTVDMGADELTGAVVDAVEIPTASGWGLALLAVALVGISLGQLRRRSISRS